MPLRSEKLCTAWDEFKMLIAFENKSRMAKNTHIPYTYIHMYIYMYIQTAVYKCSSLTLLRRNSHVNFIRNAIRK